ncbi:phage protein Gp27 family protein [Methylomagnum ishizawai]|uniref:phage protein Gp27 family protein n=1 Tax=Methylomagnum ishizawai TaxID=1760988 RepID=UPI001C3221FC|nr:phage protein Gp27 family protein [Methylomagnum ishizawai]BBL73661.1 hypothetical protein MishRS11D_07590 [Methylomagnum ishizawai]
MPPRSIIETLSPEVRDALNAKLVGSAFGDLDGMVTWLAGQGITVSRSTIGAYSQKLKTTMERAISRARERVEVARALGPMSDGDKAALLESTEMVLLDQLMEIMESWEDVKPENRPKALAGLIRAASDLGGSARGTAKWRKEFEEGIRAEERAKAAETAVAIAKKGGMSKDTAEAIRREILGIAA